MQKEGKCRLVLFLKGMKTLICIFLAVYSCYNSRLFLSFFLIPMKMQCLPFFLMEFTLHFQQ